jgi:hypothetical protein
MPLNGTRESHSNCQQTTQKWFACVNSTTCVMYTDQNCNRQVPEATHHSTDAIVDNIAQALLHYHHSLRLQVAACQGDC